MEPMFKVGDRIQMRMEYTPRWLRWRYFRNTGRRIERLIRRIAHRWGRDIWVSHEAVVTDDVTANVSSTAYWFD